MPLEIVVPQMGESIVEATVAQWLKKPGEAVKAREALVELETDKVNQVIEADADGVLTQILAEVGATVAVGQAIGVIEAGATASLPPPSAPASSAAETATPPASEGVTPVAAAMAAANNVALEGVAGTGPAGKIGKADVEAKITAPRTHLPAAPSLVQGRVGEERAGVGSGPSG